MRQLGVGTAGGAEALAIFHQLIYVLWQRGALPQPLARIKVDEKIASACWNGQQCATPPARGPASPPFAPLRRRRQQQRPGPRHHLPPRRRGAREGSARDPRAAAAARRRTGAHRALPWCTGRSSHPAPRHWPPAPQPAVLAIPLRQCADRSCSWRLRFVHSAWRIGAGATRVSFIWILYV